MASLPQLHGNRQQPRKVSEIAAELPAEDYAAHRSETPTRASASWLSRRRTSSVRRQERIEARTDVRVEEGEVLLRIGQLAVVLQPDKAGIARRTTQ